MTLKLKKLSYLLLAATLIITSCGEDNNNNDNTSGTPDTTPKVEVPAVINYTIVKEYPHDPKAFTEGLQFVDGFLYESAGQYEMSDIRKTELETGKVLQKTTMEPRYFGEGLAVIKDKVYQLTYREQTGFVYDLKTLKQLGTFKFYNREGWGMTTDGTNLIYDDGGSTLYFMDPNSFQEVKRVEVVDERGAVNQLNELEYIKGFIYANQWQTDYIYKIDPATGKVVGKANLFDLRQKANIPYPIAGDETSPEVMNGIAYDAVSNRIFITGKNWPKLIEIKLDN
jgi:glutamine cyclotransferase